MSLRRIDVIIKEDVDKNIDGIIEKLPVIDFWKRVDGFHHSLTVSLLVSFEHAQLVLDALRLRLGEGDDVRVVVSPVSATLPSADLETTKALQSRTAFLSGISREELYANVADNAVFNWHFLLLVFLSTLVAAVGILESNAVTLIGAALIAPLLGPNLALALATTLGDFKLIGRSIRTTLLGLGFCVLFAFLIGLLWHYGLHIDTLAAHVTISYNDIVLASASGAAAALSLLTGLSGTLVGVMVAVALLPPAAKVGIALAFSHYFHALDAGLLLLINLVCVNLFANLVFLFKGIKPSRWHEKQKAKRANFWLFLFLASMLIFLVVVIYFWGPKLKF